MLSRQASVPFCSGQWEAQGRGGKERGTRPLTISWEMFFFFGAFESTVCLLKPDCTNVITLSFNIHLGVKEKILLNCQVGPTENNVECWESRH